VNRCEHRQALDREINAVFSTCSKESLVTRLTTGKIAFGVLNSVAEFSSHPHLRRTDMDTPAGTVKVVSPPAEFSTGERTMGAVPSLGEHNQTIRDEFQDLNEA